MNVTTFQAECLSCNTTFAYPLLSDHSYGEFIAQLQACDDYVYISSFAQPAWERISKCFSSSAFCDVTTPEAVDCFHWVVGRCIDTIGNQAYSIGQPTCPSCGSRRVSYSDTGRVGLRDIPDASFRNFMRLSEMDQARFVQNLVSEYISYKSG